MKLRISNILDKHKNKKAIICGHGPSLNEVKDQIIDLQNKDQLLRFSFNNWYDYFNTPPTYWVLSNTNYNIRDMFGRMNEFGCPVLYSIDGDPTDEQFIEDHLKCNYLPYDQRHFKGRDCISILKSFKAHYEKNQNFSFKEYGNNEIMWHPPKIGAPGEWAGFDLHARCCSKMVTDESTIQEYLQQVSSHESHYSTADTVAIHGIAFAILMGCNPIYVVGVDLDYGKGYANENASINMDHFNIWQKYKKNLLNDLKILKESANNRNIEIINLYKSAWYGTFAEGNIS